MRPAFMIFTVRLVCALLLVGVIVLQERQIRELRLQVRGEQEEARTAIQEVIDLRARLDTAEEWRRGEESRQIAIEKGVITPGWLSRRLAIEKGLIVPGGAGKP